jgi:hypothetical protein
MMELLAKGIIPQVIFIKAEQLSFGNAKSCFIKNMGG